jgi:hypothetical protein
MMRLAISVNGNDGASACVNAPATGAQHSSTSTACSSTL